MHPKALLDTAAELLRAVLTFEHPADAVVSRFFRDNRNLGPRERATLAETTYNVLRKKLLFEAFAQSAPKGIGDKARRLTILGFDAPRDFLKAALTDTEKTWLDACDATRPDDPQSGLLDMHRHNLPDWLVAPLKAQLGDEFWPFVQATNAPAALDVRVNTFKQKRDAARELLAQAAIKSVATPYSPWGLRLAGKPQINKLKLFEEGAIEVQDEGSQLLALLLDAKRGEMVADFCAGAGGKTLAIGAAMRNSGRLYAFDTSAHRLEALKPRLARSGLSNVHPAAIAHERDERIKRLAGKLDRVLVDAPCSGLGTLRRNPDLKWRQKPQDLEELCKKQSAILASAARLVKSGGRLVYATCSVLPQENEAIAQAFSAAHPDFVPLVASEVLQELKVPQAESLCSAGAQSVGNHSAKSSEDASVGLGNKPGLYLRLWPQRHASDGFFAALWQKR
jgi:16S rRNA (cytosine967-C5)-methyltransferase